jgi:hypothetical protein
MLGVYSFQTQNFYSIAIDNKESVLSHRTRSPEDGQFQDRLILEHNIIKGPPYFLFPFTMLFLACCLILASPLYGYKIAATTPDITSSYNNVHKQQNKQIEGRVLICTI